MNKATQKIILEITADQLTALINQRSGDELEKVVSIERTNVVETESKGIISVHYNYKLGNSEIYIRSTFIGMVNDEITLVNNEY